MTATAPQVPESAEWTGRLDRFVATAANAAAEFRRLDQEAVDRIVWAMVVAGLESAVELAELAMEETGFGVFEDKVLKNYIATEFLYDYLKDKRSVGVIDEDPARGIQYVAEPIGVVLALTPITNPTSTVLFKAIVAAKTRNAMIFRPSARAARCAERAIEILCEAGERAGLPKGALQVIPDPTLDVSQYLFHHPGVDFIWTTGGPKAVAAANAAGKPCISVGAGNAPVYVHGSADVPMAVVDLLISKTFDASVICPAEQTCVVDDSVYDEMVAELTRMGARVLTREEADALAQVTIADDGRIQMAALGRSCPDLTAMAGIDPGDGDKVLVAPLPTDLDELAEHPFLQEKLMPVLGLVRSPSVDHGIAACELVTEHGGLGHTSAVYATDEAVIDRFSPRSAPAASWSTRPTAVGALGGVYNSMTPTFSLGCGTWGGSTTTDNVNYRNLLNVKTVSRRQTPPQWFRVPANTYFNAGSIESLRELGVTRAVVVTDEDTESRGAVDQVRAQLPGASVHVFADVEPEPGEATVAAELYVAPHISKNMRDERRRRRFAVGAGTGDERCVRSHLRSFARKDLDIADNLDTVCTRLLNGPMRLGCVNGTPGASTSAENSTSRLCEISATGTPSRVRFRGRQHYRPRPRRRAASEQRTRTAIPERPGPNTATVLP